MPHPPLVLACIAAAALGGEAPAQGRIATAGRVVDRAGDPVGRAVVTFTGDQPPFHVASTAPDVVSATTDAQGRFRAELRRGHEYEAWATGERELDGRCQVSALHDAVLPGVWREITMVRRRSAARLVVRGAEAWGDVGPLRLRVAADSRCNHAVDLSADGTLPPLPDERSWLVFVDDAAGRPLAVVVQPPATGDVPFLVPRPRDVAIRVTTAAGTPAPGVSVSAMLTIPAGRDLLGLPRSRMHWRLLGRTDGDGALAARLPRLPGSDGARDLPALLASDDAQGIALHHGGPAPPDGVVPLQLAPRPRWRGRLAADARPLAAARLLVCGQWLAPGGSASSVVAVADTDERGELRCHPAMDLLAGPRLLAAGPFQERTDVPTWPAALRAAHADEELQRDLSRLPVLTVQVLAAGGEPARHALVGLVPDPPAASLREEPWLVRLDARGRAVIPVDAGTWHLFATDFQGFAAHAVDVAMATTVRLQLVPLAQLRGRLLLPPRDDPRTATFGIGTMSFPRRPADGPAAVAQLVAQHLNPLLLARATVAADGGIALPFLAVPGATIRCWVKTERGRAQFDLAASEKPVEIRLQ